MSLVKLNSSLENPEVKDVVKVMRNALTYDQELRTRLSDAGESEISGVLQDKFWGQFPDENVVEASKYIATETIELRKNLGSYLISNDQIVMKITSDMIYTPPDSTDEHGNKRPGLPMLHPKISSGMMMLAQQKEESNKIKSSVPERLQNSIAHLDNPNLILNSARESLERNLIEIVEKEDCDTHCTFEIGRENVAELKESPNFNFNRIETFGSALSFKIRSIGTKKVHLASIKKLNTSKQSWYEVLVYYKLPNLRMSVNEFSNIYFMLKSILDYTPVAIYRSDHSGYLCYTASHKEYPFSFIEWKIKLNKTKQHDPFINISDMKNISDLNLISDAVKFHIEKCKMCSIINIHEI